MGDNKKKPTSDEIMQSIDWKKTKMAFDRVKHTFESMGFVAPEIIWGRYLMLIEELNDFANELKIFDKMKLYRETLVKIMETGDESSKKLAKEALDR